MPASLHAGMKVAPKTPENGKGIAGQNHTLFPADLHVDNTLNRYHQAATVEYCKRLSMNSWTPVRCRAAPLSRQCCRPHHFSAPTGRKKIAQGKIANRERRPGYNPKTTPHSPAQPGERSEYLRKTPTNDNFHRFRSDLATLPVPAPVSPVKVAPAYFESGET